jgi:hypothetical protein
MGPVFDDEFALHEWSLRVTTRKEFLMRTVSVALLVLLLAAATGACGDDDVGVECKIAARADDAGTDDNTFINPQALDCRSRLCLFYGAGGATKAYCTKICESPDDCPKDTASCPEGYACMIGQTVGTALKCCKVCVCRKFVPVENPDPNASTCAGITTNCPKL